MVRMPKTPGTGTGYFSAYPLLAYRGVPMPALGGALVRHAALISLGF